MNFFSSIYFLLITPSLLFLIGASSSLYKKAFSRIIAILVLPTYLLGTYRSAGVDIKAYRRIFENSSQDMFDPGFLLLINFFKFIGIGFEGFLLSMGVITSFLYLKISKFFNVEYGILMLILMLHIFLVRDFSQLRVGLAISIVIFSFTYSSNLKYIGYLLGISLHLTSIVLISLLIYYEIFLRNRSSFLRIILPILVIVIIGNTISYLGAFDPRIDLYLSWEREGYGAPVNSFKQPFFIIFIVIFHLYFSRKNIFQIDLFYFTYLAAFTIFFAFSDYSIFSYRLSNVAMSLYPITIAYMYENSRPALNKVAGILVFVTLISLRENSFEIINSIRIG